MLKSFKEFIIRGNLIDLAAAVVIGVGFGSVVRSFFTNLNNRLAAALASKPDFSALKFTLKRRRHQLRRAS